ncbi:ClpXP protease specificity-enhancing factor [Salinisphaera hydrothermalis]|uniref:ClpXP protease specificity-enhancing factor n=1 Tax=Salinisphaera hydrothermalis TaxID=563188 RepID=UPI00333F4D58
MAELTSRRPYLIRALYDWVLDNDLTPHLLVAADAPGVNVPRQFVTDDGKITINISPTAVRGLALENQLISFSARFSGANYNVAVPPGAVLALYARENGEGMLFGEVEEDETASEETIAGASQDASETSDETGGGDDSDAPARKKHPHLKVVK